MTSSPSNNLYAGLSPNCNFYDDSPQNSLFVDPLYSDPSQVPASLRQQVEQICASFRHSYHDSSEKRSDRRRKLGEQLKEELWRAACLRDYQLAGVQKSYEAEVEQIEMEFESEKANLRDKLLSELLEHRKRLTEGMGDEVVSGSQLDAQTLIETGKEKTVGGAGQRKLRGKRGESDKLNGVASGAAGGTSSKRRQAQIGLEGLPLGVQTLLGDNDLCEDLSMLTRRFTNINNASSQNINSISSNLRRHTQNKNTSTEGEHEQVYVKGDTLYYHGETFTREHEVVVGTPDGSQLSGIISDVGPKELWIKIEDGAKLKITYQQLKAARYTLSHLGDSNDED